MDLGNSSIINYRVFFEASPCAGWVMGASATYWQIFLEHKLGSYSPMKKGSKQNVTTVARCMGLSQLCSCVAWGLSKVRVPPLGAFLSWKNGKICFLSFGGTQWHSWGKITFILCVDDVRWIRKLACLRRPRQHMVANMGSELRPGQPNNMSFPPFICPKPKTKETGRTQ